MKNTLILLALLTLGACGFTPMYGSDKGAAARLDQVDIALIPDASGVSLRNQLIDRFYSDGYPVNPRYELIVSSLNETKSDLDITIESEATRRQLRLTTIMDLIDKQTGEKVLTRSISAYSSYNVIGSQFTTRVGEGDAREAALADLARQIETQLSLYFNR